MHSIFIIHPSISPKLANRVFLPASVPRKFSGDILDYSRLPPPWWFQRKTFSMWLTRYSYFLYDRDWKEEKEKKEKKDYQWELSHPDRVSSFFFLNRGKKKKRRGPTSDTVCLRAPSHPWKFPDLMIKGTNLIYFYSSKLADRCYSPGQKALYGTRKQGGVYFVLAPKYAQILYHIFLFHPCFQVLQYFLSGQVSQEAWAETTSIIAHQKSNAIVPAAHDRQVSRTPIVGAHRRKATIQKY